MSQPTNEPTPPAGPERPTDIPETEWNTLGDPGKQAIVRERARTAAATQQVAALRAELAQAARPTPPPGPTTPPPSTPPAPAPTPAAPAPAQPDIAAIVAQAVAAAFKPFEDREQQRTTQEAAQAVQTAVAAAAKGKLQDPTDALVQIDLTKVVNDQGQPDPAKITAELDALVAKKPHLAKSDLRFAPAGIGGGAPAAVPEAEKVKAIHEAMQQSAGIRPAASN